MEIFIFYAVFVVRVSGKSRVTLLLDFKKKFWEDVTL